MRARGDIAAIGSHNFRAHHFPLRHRREIDLGRNKGRESFRGIRVFREICVGDRTLMITVLSSDAAPPSTHKNLRFGYIPLLRGIRKEQMARGGRAFANIGNRARRRPAAGGNAIVRRKLRVGHDELNLVRADAELLRRSLRDLGARSVPGRLRLFPS